MGRESRSSRDRRFTVIGPGPGAGPHSGPGSARDAEEWVGGRVLSPFYVTEGTPYRPEMLIWLEMPQRLVLRCDLIAPGDEPRSLGRALRQAMAAPLVGPPRTPRSIRVADEQQAAEVRAALPGVAIVVAPTPELDRFVREMSESMPTDSDRNPPSYLEDGRVGSDLVEELFEAARLLHNCAPWKRAQDGQVLRVDIPELGVEAGCLSIIGALGQSLGFIIFPSYGGYLRFLELAEAPRRRGPIDLGTTTLCLNFCAGSELPPSMHREALSRGWPVANPKAFPLVEHRDRDGMPRPLVARDVRIVSACALSLCTLFLKHGKLFRQDPIRDPMCESYFDGNNLEVRFTVPFEAEAFFKANRPESWYVGGGDADPAPGGGRADGDAPAGGSTPSPVHDLDRIVVTKMVRYAEARFGPDWDARLERTFRDPRASSLLSGPWACFHHLVAGKPLAGWFREEQAPRLSAEERSWLDSQAASWLSIWEVTAVEPGRSLSLRDVLTGETRQVAETAASLTVTVRDSLLARVVDYEGVSVLCGTYPRSLPPREADTVLQLARRRLRLRGQVPVERMRSDNIARHLVTDWEEAVEELDERRSIPPVMQNMDGELMQFTVDHFTVKDGQVDEVRRRLGAAEEVTDPPEPGEPDASYDFCRPGNRLDREWEATLLGRVTVTDTTLRLECNSIARADTLRRRLEVLLEGMVRHRSRELIDHDALSPFEGDAGSGPPPPGGPSGPEVDRLVLEFKAKHYADWADHPVPALEGKTPRAMARTKTGRERVGLLLREMEHLEAKLPPGQRFDYSGIRRDLGLE